MTSKKTKRAKTLQECLTELLDAGVVVLWIGGSPDRETKIKSLQREDGVLTALGTSWRVAWDEPGGSEHWLQYKSPYGVWVYAAWFPPYIGQDSTCGGVDL